MGAPASTHQVRLVPSYVESGRVVDVDVESYRLSVVTQMTQKSFVGLSFATPYQHGANGEGIYFMPEVGSLVWLCWPSDNANRPFVMSWAPMREDSGSMRSGKLALNPGDIYLGTRDENFIILRRGGIVQIGGGPLSQRLFMPINNVIKDICENYSLNTIGGDLEWSVQRPEKSADGKRPALLSIRAKEYANDDDYVALLEMGSREGNVSENGSHTANAQNILSLAIKASGKKGAAKKISLEFRKDGSAAWSFEGDVEWMVKKSLSVDVEKELFLMAGELARLEGKTVEIEAAQGAVGITGKTTVDIMAGASVNLGPQVNMGVTPGAGGAVGLKPMMLADDDFLTWLINHVHICAPPGSPSQPATDLRYNPSFGKVQASQGHKAKKSFGK